MRQDQEHLWGIKDIATYLKMGKTEAYRIKDTQGFPRPIKLGKKLLYVPKEVRDWTLRQRA